MAPTNTGPTGHLDWKIAKQVCNAQDIERLACAFLNTEDIHRYNSTTAAAQWGSGKPESFKRAIWVIARKIKEAEGGSGDGAATAGDGNAGKKTTKGEGKPKGGAGRKRKKDDEDGGDDAEGGAKATKKGKRGGRGKAAELSDEVNDDAAANDDIPVKGELDSGDEL